MKDRRFAQKAFFSRKFLGFSIEFVFDPPLFHPVKSFAFQITLFWFRYWFVLYKGNKLY